MSLAARDVAGYYDPSEVPGIVKQITITGYLAAVVATALIYVTGICELTVKSSLLNFHRISLHFRSRGKRVFDDFMACANNRTKERYFWVRAFYFTRSDVLIVFIERSMDFRKSRFLLCE